MSEFKITGPGLYKTRNGQKAEVLGRASLVSLICPWAGSITDRKDVATWDDEGRWISSTTSPQDLIAPWTEPKKGTVWVNVWQYENDPPVAATPFSSREMADRSARLETAAKRLACIQVNWTEGEGL